MNNLRHTEMAFKAMRSEYLHRAVWPLLVADKVVGGEHHLADITVKARFMPVLIKKRWHLKCDFIQAVNGLKLLVILNDDGVHSL